MDTFANMDTTVDRNTPYTSRPWIITALSLRFNDALTYREIAEQLKVSTSATHKMFKRFRRTGINWPLPEDYTPERLEEELYAFNLETNLPVKKRRPDWPLEFKIRMAELSLQPDACVAKLTREHGVNDNLVFNWRNLHRQGLLDPATRAGMIPVTVEPFPVPARQNGGTPDSPPVISCKLTLPGGTLSLTGPVTPELLRALVSAIRGSEV
ncbi:IS66-like element accessory protein TnpA [Pantoea allii]|uniref:IS66-like element accessory protein TnpA n=2 Tax=Pantoea allii TaxID=574096 RepID=A0ABS6VMQ0_9GAMM|nr:IS66-like element accessory protein TnpA [Pantoea allii]MBW1216481.1 IS66-like element accessory protein TnpA [Pantoea allii]MBW1254659.1 IS66-like element accessory protein TnpA [Pantoea allii]MBW1260087.1 IS66-like element accessory protein TnpA [Pantoea allii]MBW1263681.1 IS66-like element accessory protein TnpA [Pantoea allii]MBW1269188.1 IS66-like element accessory protein TnpA [Pantoea allii]